MSEINYEESELKICSEINSKRLKCSMCGSRSFSIHFLLEERSPSDPIAYAECDGCEEFGMEIYKNNETPRTT